MMKSRQEVKCWGERIAKAKYMHDILRRESGEGGKKTQRSWKVGEDEKLRALNVDLILRVTKSHLANGEFDLD